MGSLRSCASTTASARRWRFRSAGNAAARSGRLTIENASGRARRLDVTTYAELVLNTPVADAAHPAFSKLFVQTEWDDASQALLAKRRLRATDDEPLWVIHTLRIIGGDGRARVRDGPDALHWPRAHHGAPARRSTLARSSRARSGAVLDPIFALRTRADARGGRDRRSSSRCSALGARARRSSRSWRSDVRRTRVAKPQRRGNGDRRRDRQHDPRDRFRPARAPRSDDAREARARSCASSTASAGSPATAPSTSFGSNATPSGLRWPPMPWSNVIANESAGCIVTGERRRHELEREQQRESAHAVVQRSGVGSVRRGDLSARRWQRRLLVAASGTHARARAVRGAARLRLHELAAHEP